MEFSSRVTRSILSAAAALALQSLLVSSAPAAETITALIADLGSNNNGTMQKAKDELLVQGKRAIPLLVAALDDTDRRRGRPSRSCSGSSRRPRRYHG